MGLKYHRVANMRRFVILFALISTASCGQRALGHGVEAFKTAPRMSDGDRGGGTGAPIQVGSTLSGADHLIRKVEPVYPPRAKEARIQGIVRFTATIGKDGRVRKIQLVSGHPLLVEAARAALKQWIYRPTLLNREPVDVVTSVDIQFTLSQ
jgi:TonB family protein